MGQETITLTNAEMKKVLVVEINLRWTYDKCGGAAVLGITPRQVIRLRKSTWKEERRELLKLSSGGVARLISPAKRKPQAGMLWQIDATPFMS